ncbi:hypothetical protein C6H64_21575 [Photorhabdus luminescens]|uniref:hypothetical protein n=1 Tax=Photorhabdus akhurstii TaxID=171438 RepID=UPI000CF96C33|nr:hypothetical protein C6H64_21575 [Photorhabdus luminescens]PQQ26608.1 hypothetical protein C6H69_21415 [Photorhabdus luminescens]PQQ41599.1 hypothetical protein C6H65_08520 [Photorhabdus luminescens]
MGIIHVTNNMKNDTIEVAINYWSTDYARFTVSDDYFNISPGYFRASWFVDDWRGYIMSVKRQGITFSYFILPDTKIIVGENRVTENEYVIKPLFVS